MNKTRDLSETTGSDSHRHSSGCPSARFLAEYGTVQVCSPGPPGRPILFGRAQTLGELISGAESPKDSFAHTSKLEEEIRRFGKHL
jgi:hypothetical protein